MSVKRKICIVTGTRAEYGILSSVMKAVHRHPKLELQVLATGMHLSHEYGYTVDEIKQDGWKIDATVDMLVNGDSLAAMSKSVGLGIIGMTQSFEQLNPDFVLVLGDRDEPLAATIAAAHMNIPVAHLHGGEVTGTIDESIRHSITKFAHLHFPATEKSVARIKKMGEDEFRIHLVGAPGLDSIFHQKILSKGDLKKIYPFNFNEPYILAVQHPVTSEYNQAEKNMKKVMKAIDKTGIPTIFIYANADASNKRMMQSLIDNKFQNSSVKFFVTLPHRHFLSIMKNAAAMVGNTSCGIIEAPSWGVPYICVGTRQNGRERAPNVIDVPYETSKIEKAIKQSFYDQKFKKECKKKANPYNPFGDARAGERIAEFLSKIKINQQLIQKKITY